MWSLKYKRFEDLNMHVRKISWWRHQMETFSALLPISAGNSPVPGEFPAQRTVTRSFDFFFDQRPNKRLSKQSWGWWFETLSRPLWRQCNGNIAHRYFRLQFGSIKRLRISQWSYCVAFLFHDDAIKWKHFLRYWPFVRRIHRWLVNSPHKLWSAPE